VARGLIQVRRVAAGHEERRFTSIARASPDQSPVLPGLAGLAAEQSGPKRDTPTHLRRSGTGHQSWPELAHLVRTAIRRRATTVALRAVSRVICVADPDLHQLASQL
jgi:hypothetical protein